MHGVSTANTPDKNNDPLQKGKNKLGPQRKNISSIMRGFKSSVTIDTRKINSDFGWQSRFNDHVIRGKESEKMPEIKIEGYDFSLTIDEY